MLQKSLSTTAGNIDSTTLIITLAVHDHLQKNRDKKVHAGTAIYKIIAKAIIENIIDKSTITNSFILITY